MQNSLQVFDKDARYNDGEDDEKEERKKDTNTQKARTVNAQMT